MKVTSTYLITGVDDLTILVDIVKRVFAGVSVESPNLHADKKKLFGAKKNPWHSPPGRLSFTSTTKTSIRDRF